MDGLENAPKALNRLFDGSNLGKMVVRVSEEPAAASQAQTYPQYPLN